MRAWLTLIKFRYHVTFVSVLCGAVLFAPRLDAALFGQLLLLYLCFNVLVYGGIYTFNDIADRASDLRHPGKRCRPVASGAVSVPAACLFGLLLITAGLTLGYFLFQGVILACFGAALVFNAFYSLFARNRRYFDLVFNSATHPNRFLLGTLLVGQVPPVTHLLALMMLAMALSCLRRDVERDVAGWEARTTIAGYTPRELTWVAAACLTVLAVLATCYGHSAPGFYLIVGTTAGLIAIGGWLDTSIRGSLRTIWTR